MTTLTKELAARLLNPELMPGEVVIGGKTYRLKESVGSGVTGAVWRATDERGTNKAIKFAIREHYDSNSYRQELDRAARLENYPEFARLIDAAIINISFTDGMEAKFVGFVEQWVDGVTLNSLVAEHSDQHTVSMFLALVRGFAEILSVLSVNELRHDDLNPSNVMVVPPLPGVLNATSTLKIVDLSSLKPSDRPASKKRNKQTDHQWVVQHLVTFWNAIHRRRALTIRDRRFLHEVKQPMRSMAQDDPANQLSDPEQIRSQFEEAFVRSLNSSRSTVLSLSDPFDFISAEHNWDDRLLVRLFAPCPWLPKIIGPDSCLLTGPRGCGKSTIFRWMSLKAQLLTYPDRTSKDFEEQVALSGFYLSCSMDLQNRLAWVKQENVARDFASEIIHYFNLLAAREVLLTLQLIERRSDRESYWSLGAEAQKAILKFIVGLFPMTENLASKGSLRSRRHPTFWKPQCLLLRRLSRDANTQIYQRRRAFLEICPLYWCKNFQYFGLRRLHF